MMIQKYSLREIAIHSTKPESYHIDHFESMEDPVGIVLPHTHDFYSMVWFTGGNGWDVIDFDEYEIRPNRLFFTSPYSVHNWSYSADARGYVVLFTELVVPEVFSCKIPFVDMDLTSSAFFNTVAEKLLMEYALRDGVSDQSICHGLQFLAACTERLFLQAHGCPRGTSSAALQQFKDLISQNSLPQRQVTDYAESLKLSEHELNDLCVNTTGKTAKQFIIDQYLIEAKRLLLYTSENVNEIAYELGFEDSSYFIRLFKKKNGLTPAKFKAKFQ